MSERDDRKQWILNQYIHFGLNYEFYGSLCQDFVETGEGDPVSVLSKCCAELSRRKQLKQERSDRKALIKKELFKAGLAYSVYSQYLSHFINNGIGDYVQIIATFAARKELLSEELAKNGFSLSPNSPDVTSYIGSGMDDPVHIVTNLRKKLNKIRRRFPSSFPTAV
ncbi:hypothetical protein RCL1_003473 [Eukaryota sp. TZLM3-RCL]